MKTPRMKAARERAAPKLKLSHGEALELLLAARRLGPAVVHQDAPPAENQGDCCGGMLWRAALSLEHTLLPHPGAFPVKTKLALFLRTLGLTSERAHYFARLITDSNDSGQIDAAWDLCAEAVGVSWSEVVAAEQEAARGIKMPSPSRPAHLEATGRMQNCNPRPRSGARAEELVEA